MVLPVAAINKYIQVPDRVTDEFVPSLQTYKQFFDPRIFVHRGEIDGVNHLVGMKLTLSYVGYLFVVPILPV